ncbi:receptor-type tyrosine-protein phosphatase alpha-like [Mya arenaria]|uniref:receptor-type tyrosine-protein phosphatase alpha-like n=1 Tax=Mya arenaria TaxID=6604 RepID=UPI0022E97EB3|nr:receptor-type tyrosine-protein phosphatase alpha-like [Mya arenaria]
MECVAGYYGANCNISCSSGCRGDSCMKNGVCIECITGYYGEQCKDMCSKGCSGEVCYRNGTCACTDNFRGTYCDECVVGKYGENCQNECSFGCSILSCGKEDGSCLDGCKDGLYGINCSQKCTDIDSKCLKCSQLGGTCLMCNKGFYRNETGTCTTCNSNCNNGECNPETGKCINGCAERFWGDKCDFNCSSKCETCQQDSGICYSCTDFTVHGLYCNTSCSSLCFERKCELKTGFCSLGCSGDFFGHLCNTKCPENCLRSGAEMSCDNNGRCNNGCIDGFEETDCTVAALPVGPPVGAIVGGLIGCLVVIIGVVVAILFFRRRSIRLPFSDKSNRNSHTIIQANITDENELPLANERTYYNEGQIMRESKKTNQTGTRPLARMPVSVKQHESARVVTASENEIDLEIDDEKNTGLDKSSKDNQTYYNELGSSTKKSKIPIDQLVKYVDGKSPEAYSEEFENFSRGLVKPYVESQKKENMSKNRYKGIYPYDDSRVKVRGSGSSDYINASFINGYKKPKQYIATLGPMSNQLGDFSLFWRMIWQQRVEKIVMVTNMVEHSSPKCEQYWPNPGTTKKYGDIMVENRSEDEFAEFTRRTFTVTLGTEARTLHHLHFTCWPDKAIPDDVTAMIEFRQRVLSTQSPLNGPTVVHCSAGVGRTGTYIALDILTKEGEAEGAIDIAGCVTKMRKNRPNMVQTLGQYQFLHTAAVYSLTFDSKQIRGENFNQYMNKVTTQELNSLFTQLQHTVEKRSKDEAEAVERNKQHLNKNRANADIPGNENRPRLHLNLKPGASDYINAVYIHSFRIKKRYLVAQTPLSETIIDFLTLVVQESCSCIVSFEANMDKQKNIGMYYPAANQDILKKGTFQVSSSREENRTFYTERTLTIQHKEAGNSTDRSIQHLQYTDWDEMKNIPRSTTNFLSFLNVIEKVVKQQDDGPILVHCFDGAGKSGLFCVVSLLLTKMAVEHEVSVLNAVRKIKTTRRLAIPNQEQFVFCHGCVSEYLRSFEVYANFHEET